MIGDNERTWPTCIDCNEPDSASLPGCRCRDCDIEHVIGRGSCRECDHWIKREDMYGPRATQHKPGCSLANAEDWRPLPTHDDVWKAALGALYDASDDYDREADRLGADDPRVPVLRVIVADLRSKAERWRREPAPSDGGSAR